MLGPHTDPQPYEGKFDGILVQIMREERKNMDLNKYQLMSVPSRCNHNGRSMQIRDDIWQCKNGISPNP